jgi:DNA-binding NarL/FixJ family response regulator
VCTFVLPRPAIRVVVLADVRLYREGLARVLSGREGLVVAGSGPADGDGFELVALLLPDVVLMEARAAYATPMVRDLATLAPAVAVVAYGLVEEDSEAVQCAEAGVAGYISQDASEEELVSTVLAVTRGEFRCSPRVSALLMRRVSALADERRAPSEARELTLREREIVRLIDQGLSNKEIARRLGIGLSTVKSHVHNVLEKLRVERRVQAAAHVRRTRVRAGSAGGI